MKRYMRWVLFVLLGVSTVLNVGKLRSSLIVLAPHSEVVEGARNASSEREIVEEPSIISDKGDVDAMDDDVDEILRMNMVDESNDFNRGHNHDDNVRDTNKSSLPSFPSWNLTQFLEDYAYLRPVRIKPGMYYMTILHDRKHEGFYLSAHGKSMEVDVQRPRPLEAWRLSYPDAFKHPAIFTLAIVPYAPSRYMRDQFTSNLPEIEKIHYLASPTSGALGPIQLTAEANATNVMHFQAYFGVHGAQEGSFYLCVMKKQKNGKWRARKKYLGLKGYQASMSTWIPNRLWQFRIPMSEVADEETERQKMPKHTHY